MIKQDMAKPPPWLSITFQGSSLQWQSDLTDGLYEEPPDGVLAQAGQVRDVMLQTPLARTMSKSWHAVSSV